MDRTAHHAGQVLTGNPSGGAAIEIDVQGIALACTSGAVDLALTGGDFALQLDGNAAGGWCLAGLRQGQAIDITIHRWGSWCYLAFAGKIETAAWLGSQSVNPGWSISGSRLKAGDEIRVSSCRHSGHALRRLPIPIFARPSPVIHVVPGPQERFFAPEAFERLYGQVFSISTQYNRQGIRLEGPPLPVSAPLDMPSEPILRGAIQVDGSGQASVLMADHQTTGGYPKIGTVVSADQDCLAQLRPRTRIRFAMTTPEDGIARLRRRQASLSAYLEAVRRNFP
jgi:biotin-dependent carboxylase-like uncharacterized protein